MKNNDLSEHRLRPYVRYFAYAQIALQGLLPAILAFSPAVMAAQQPTIVSETTTSTHSLLLPNLDAPVKATAPTTTTSSSPATEQSVAHSAQTMASLAASDDSSGAAQQYLMGQATAQATQEIEKWLNAYGNARVTINANTRSDSTMDGSSFDFLLPVINNKENLTFMQFSTHYQDDDRLVGNIGIGQRFFFPSGWMFGLNGFYDQDLSGTTSRAGAGIETWADNFKFSGNGYFAISDWKNSDELDGYDEKAANGFDLQIDSYLPSYPQLGGKLKYEKYFGDDVALFDTDHLQNNPSAVTVGVNYTPIPLVTLAVNYKTGQDDMDDTSFNLGFNYQLGVPWSEQTSTDAVGLRRSLEGSRLDFVNRNNDIVMQYRKQRVIKLGLPDTLSGEVLAVVPLAAAITAKNGADRIQWDPSSTLLTAGGQVTKVDITHYTVKMPPQPGEYRLRGVAYDKEGNSSNTAETQFTANQATLTSKVTVDNTQVPVGQNATYTLKVTNASNQPVAGAEVTWDNKAFGNFVSSPDETTNDKGEAKAVLTSTVEGEAHMAATVNDVEVASIPVVNFTSGLAAATISSLTLAAPQSVAANGTDKLTYTATLLDSSNNPVANQDISWKSDVGTPLTGTSKTDAKGQATFAVSSTVVAPKVTVTATFATSGSSQSNVQGSFTGDASTAVVSDLTVAPDTTQPADGTAVFTYQATVKDSSGNTLQGVTVNWTKDSSNALFVSSTGGNTSVTDANGIAKISLSNTKAETVEVTAAAGDTPKKDATVTFVADAAAATISDLVLAAPQAVFANGTDKLTYTATLKDSHDNPIADQDISWTSDVGTPLTGTSKTDTNGQAIFTVSSTDIATKVTVVATFAATNSSQTNTQGAFIADTGTAAVTDLTVLPTDDQPANGTPVFTYSATVKDAEGHPLPGITVNWDKDSTAAQFASSSGSSTSVTDDTGVAHISLSNTKGETVKVTATVGSTPPKDVSVNFVVDMTKATISSLTLADPQAVAANGTDKLTYTATLEDAYNNPIADQDISWTSDVGTPTSGTSKTDAKGQATFTVASTAIAAKVTVKASFTSSGSEQTNTQGSFIADASTAVVSDLNVLPQNNQPANGVAIFTYTAKVKDAQGNTLEGITVNWDKDSTTAQFASSTGKNSSVTDKNGVAQITLSDTIAEDVKVTATAGSTGPKDATVNFVADIATAVLVVKAEPVVLPADGTTTTLLTADVKDAHLNPVTGMTVSWNVDGSSAVLGDQTSVTGDDGVTRTTLKDATAENVTLTASITQGAHTMTQLKVLFTPVAAVATSVTLSTPDTAYWTDYALGTAEVGHLTATVLDAESSPVPGATVTYKMVCASGGSDCSNKPLAGGSTGPQGENIVEVASATAAVSGITIQACTTPEGGSEICSAAATLPFYAPPVVSKTFKMVGNGGDITALPGDRLQYGEIQATATGGNGTYTWSSADDSAATVNSSGVVKLMDNKPTTIQVTSMGRESKIDDSLPITAGSDMLYVAGSSYTTYDAAVSACSGMGGAMKSSGEILPIVNAWGGDVTHFSAYDGVTPVFVAWVTDLGNGGGVSSTVELYNTSASVKTNIGSDEPNAYPACVK